MEVTYKHNSNVTAKFDTREGTFDEMIVGEIWKDVYYTPDSTFSIKQGDTVIDIGAHIGTFTVLAAKLGANVYSYEPNPENFALFTRNVVQNRVHPFVTENNKAVSGDRTVLYLNKSPHDFEKNTGGFGTTTEKIENSDEVPAVPINEVLNDLKRVDFLKVDCEGGEYDIFEHISPENMGKIEKIAMEYHESLEKAQNLLKFFNENGFKTHFWDTSNTSALGKIMVTKC